MIDTAKLSAKSGHYRIASSGGVTDKILLEIAGQYETTVSRKMTALKPEELTKRFQSAEPILETTKYDGEGVFIYYEQGKESFAFNTPSGRVRLGFKALIELEQHLKTSGAKKGLFRAELYLAAEKEGKRAGISDVIRASLNGTEREIAALKLALLDVVMLDGKDLRPNLDNFRLTWELMEKLFGTDSSRPFHRAQGSIILESEAASVFEKKLALGQEGIVLRRLTRIDLYKIKPHLTVDAAVIGFVEGEFDGQFGVTSILTALTYPDRRDGALWFQTFPRVGSGLTDQQRVQMLDAFTPLKVPAPIPMTDSDGRTINFVQPRYVAELEGDDLMATTSSDKENRTQLFSWNRSNYGFSGLTPCPRLTFPIFSKFRPDKDADSAGARIEQILKSPVLPEPRKQESHETRLVRRQVFTKAEAVRKLVVVNKTGEGVVPYLIYWTDYSSKRKDPLKVSTAYAFTEARAHALAERFIAENVTKGFVLFGSPPPQLEPSAPSGPARRTKK